MKQKFHCPACDAKLEITSKISMLSESEAESKDVVERVKSHPPTGSEKALKNVERYKRNSAIRKSQWQSQVILTILSDAGPDGLIRGDLKKLAIEKGIDDTIFDKVLKHLITRAEIYMSPSDEKYHSVQL